MFRLNYARVINSIPWQCRVAIRGFFSFFALRDLSKSRLSIKKNSELRISFGGVLNDGRPIHGGAVKLLALRDGLPSDESECSHLYAVSSSLPQRAEQLFKLCHDRGIKIIWNQNGVGYPAWAGRESERFNRPMRRLRAMADFVVYQSRFCEESANRFLGECATPSVILFNPVDTYRFVPRSSPRQNGPLRLLAAGTHGTRDRVVNVLEALAHLRRGGLDATLTIAGSFQWKNAEADIEREVERLNQRTNVVRLARFSQSDAVGMYQSHDLLVHPKYMDPCPTVVLEAMACGLPIVGSATGGMPEIVPESCGALISGPMDWNVLHTPDAQSLANAISVVAGQIINMSHNARACAVERFSVGPWVESHRKIMEHVIS